MAKQSWRSLFQRSAPVRHWHEDRGLFATLGEEGTAATTTAYLVIDLSDVTNFKHGETGAIIVEWIDFEADVMSGTFNAHFGVLTELDADNGTVKFFHQIRMEKATNHSVPFKPPGGINLLVESGVPSYLVSNQELAGNALFQTDVYLPSIFGGSKIPAVGDLILLMEEETDGLCNFSTTVGYHTIP